MGHNGCDGSQASGPWAIGSGYRFNNFSGEAQWPRVVAAPDAHCAARIREISSANLRNLLNRYLLIHPPCVGNSAF